jgi:hypothetical protein
MPCEVNIYAYPPPPHRIPFKCCPCPKYWESKLKCPCVCRLPQPPKCTSCTRTSLHSTCQNIKGYDPTHSRTTTGSINHLRQGRLIKVIHLRRDSPHRIPGPVLLDHPQAVVVVVVRVVGVDTKRQLAPGPVVRSLM